MNFKRILSLFLAIFFAGFIFVSCSKGEDNSETLEAESTAEETAGTYVDIQIRNYGTVTIRLDYTQAPITCANFVKLAESGFYDGLTFHRIIDGFMIQGGDPKGDGTGGSGENIVGEFSANGYANTISHKRGVVSMARSKAYDSASSQFFIVHKNSFHLDGSYAAFGFVTSGMNIVDAICDRVENSGSNGAVAKDDQPVMTKVTVRVVE